MARDSKGRFVKKTDTSDTITGIKAFDKNMQCRGYQFEVGQTYTHNGPVKACESGFHFCENPLDVLSYYDLTDCRFARVTATGQVAKHDGDSKVAAASLTIDVEIKLPEFIRSGVNWMLKACSKDNKASGNSSQLAASGNFSKLAASGNFSQLAASGDSSIVCAAAHGCTAKSGENGTIVLSRWVEKEKRWRVTVGYVGEDGIKSDTWYSLDDNDKMVEQK